MRIAFDYQIFAAQRYGGVSRYFYEIASRMSRLDGQSVEIIAPLYVNEYLKHGDLKATGVYFPPIPRTSIVVKAISTILSNMLCRLRSEIDIFHETYYSVGDSKPNKALRVITVYDMIHEKFPEKILPNDATRYVKASAIRRADHIICISENTRKDLIEILGLEKEKTSVVYLGSSLCVSNGLVKELGGRKPYILYVGARWSHKNFNTLLNAYANSNYLSKEFDLYCFGSNNFTRSEVCLMASLGLTENSIIHLSGSDNILADLYSSAAAFVYPSLYEGFGMPPLEAMSCDCPVVCSNTSSLPEVVGDAAEMFDPTDEEALRVAIERVVFSETYRQELTCRGRARLAYFSWDKCAKQTLDVYRKLAKQD